MLEGIKGTLFRQTQFAEFELRAHQMAEKGEPLTGDALDKLYMDITKRYYGHDQGVCVVDPEIAHEWASVPHFYYNFYVFQYATSFTASAALSEKVLGGDPAATKRYRAFLAAGGSKYPDRPAEGRGRRHDDARAAAAHAPQDGPRDGPDRGDPRPATGEEDLAPQYWRRLKTSLPASLSRPFRKPSSTRKA